MTLGWRRSARVAAAAAAAVICAAGCSHAPPPGARPGQLTPRERLEQMLASLPSCSSATDAITIAAAAAPVMHGPPVNVRGYLYYAPFCNSMPCREKCCHKCAGSWELAAREQGGPPPLMLHAADGRWRRLAWTALDCELPDVRARAAAVTVIATGTLRRSTECSSLEKHTGPIDTIREELVYTQLCVVRGK